MTGPKPWVQPTTQYPRLAHDLQMVNADLELRFNFLRARYEVWGPRGLVLRISDYHDDYAPPGVWIIEVVRGNPSYRPAPDPVQRADDLEQEALRREESDKRLRDALVDSLDDRAVNRAF